jgi:hypothetical protein
MAGIKIPLPALTEGMSTRPMPDRSPGSVKLALNTTMRRIRGLEKRAGTTMVGSDLPSGALNVTTPAAGKSVHWINRDSDEQFLVLVDSANTGDARLEVFTLVARGTGDGTEGNEKAGQKMPVTSVTFMTDDPLDYITDSGAADVVRQFRMVTVADATIIVNRSCEVGLSGSAIDYQKEDNSYIRDGANSNNLPSWSDFPHPPLGTAADGDVKDDEIYYAKDDDLGWPAGWYRASSTTVPPWYTRIRTEGANSLMDHTKWPVRLDFDGTEFSLRFPSWVARYSGDSFSNPGPQLASGPSAPHAIRDVCFFQGRLWFGGYEFLDSSQSSDVFNFWNNSYVTIADTDPVNISLQSDAVTTVQWMVPFDGGIIVLTQGSRQFQITSAGAMTPSSVAILPTTSYSTVAYCAPAKMGNQLYFAAEQNGFMQIYEYIFQADRGSNVATVASAEIESLIPTRAKVIRTSPTHDLLFVLSNTDSRSLYVCQMKWENDQATQRAWQKWDFDYVIYDIQVIGSILYILTLHTDGLLYLEAMTIDVPDNDDDGETPTTVNGYSGSGDMEIALRLDGRESVQGTYDALTNTTTWVVNREDALLDTVVLGQMFDCNYEFPTGTYNTQRSKGRVLTVDGGALIVNASGGITTVVATGNYATNGNLDNAPCWVGRSYEQRVTLNEQFARDETGVVGGIVTLKKLMLRLVDTGLFRVEVTPQGRDTISYTYIGKSIGQATIGDGINFSEYDEFTANIFGSAHTTEIDLVNDSPFPSRFIGGQFTAGFITAKQRPSRR